MKYSQALTKAIDLWATLRDDGRPVGEARLAAAIIDAYLAGYNDATTDLLKLLHGNEKNPLSTEPERPQ